MAKGTVKTIGVGLVGGLLGGLLLVGGNAVLTGGSNVLSSGSSGTTQVSKTTYKTTTDVTKAVQKVQGAVVSVINLQSAQQSSSGDLWNSIFGGSESESGDSSTSGELTPASEGSGVIYKKSGSDAYVVTNNHVVEGQQGLEIQLADGTKVEGKLVGSDTYSDLAVIKIPSAKVTQVATFGDSSKLTVGEPAIALGSPLGTEYANSVTEGIVSALSRQVTTQSESGQTISTNAIQTDAAINPGNSGGALINIEGQVIGINSSKIAASDSSGTAVEGMGFAIPSNDVVSIINQLEADGKVSRPALGISMANLSALTSQQIKEELKIPDSVKSGVVILKVQAATPAESAGLERYDVITKIDGKEITNSTDLQSELYKHKVGDSLKVTYYRGDKEKTATIKLTMDASALTTSSSK